MCVQLGLNPSLLLWELENFRVKKCINFEWVVKNKTLFISRLLTKTVTILTVNEKNITRRVKHKRDFSLVFTASF